MISPSLTISEPTSQTKRPELLAPAGNRECVRAAVENGANAVYFGLDTGFNARFRAGNVGLDELAEVMTFLRSRGVRGYVTLNTLIFQNELEEIEWTVRSVAAAGVDAVIVQDLGLVRLIRAVCPDLAIHASTQMTLTSAESIRAAESLGVQRVILARELSIDEMRKIRKQTAMPLEAFVHGALCVAYSGQCLTSESLGGRSANRGQCAQACRLPYELVCDSQTRDLGEMKYLLSPQDLAAYELVPELIDAGLCSFKIEGRLKTPEYVANITRHYRLAIDAAMAGQPVAFSPKQVEEMELSFSRGFSKGWMRGCDHKELVKGNIPTKRGVFLGEVKAVRKGRVLVQLAGPIKRGDGVVFDSGRPLENEPGGRVFEVFRKNVLLEEPVSTGLVDMTFGRDAVDLRRIEPGQRVWKTDDPELTRRLRKSFTGLHPLRRVGLDLTIAAAVGEPLRVRATADSGAACEFQSPEPLELALRHPLTQEMLAEQFGRLGGTLYELRGVDATIDGAPMAPLSVLGKLRHEMVRLLGESIANPTARQLASHSALATLRAHEVDRVHLSDIRPTQPTIHALCRSLEQLRAALAEGITSVYVDFQDIREYRAAVEMAHGAGASIFLATPRIQKPTERGIFQVLLKPGADGILVRNLGGLLYFTERGIPVVGDFSLNAANDLTVAYLSELGASRVTPSYDLNREQLLDLIGAVPAAAMEIVMHQHMPMFHMEHCVFCAVLSPGTNKTNCGRPCDRHDVRLRDRLGVEHPLKADVGCRNTLFNAVPQSGAETIPVLLERGVRHFRIEFLDESPSEIRDCIAAYRDLLAGRVSGRDVWSRLKAANRVGVTRGTLEERRNPLAIL